MKEHEGPIAGCGGIRQLPEVPKLPKIAESEALPAMRLELRFDHSDGTSQDFPPIAYFLYVPKALVSQFLAIFGKFGNFDNSSVSVIPILLSVPSCALW
jgi:hypothetical protein